MEDRGKISQQAAQRWEQQAKYTNLNYLFSVL